METALGRLTFRRPTRGGSVRCHEVPIPVVFSIGESPLAPSESTAAALCVDDGAADGSRDGAVTAGRQSAAGLLDGRRPSQPIAWF